MQKHLMSKWRSFFNAYICLLTCHRHVIHYRSLRFSFMIAKRKAPLGVLSFLVDPRRIDSRRLDARSVIAALTCRRHVIHYRSLRFSFMIAKRKAPLWVLSFLVDPRRIELLSEKRSAGLSPSAFRLLKFPPHSAGRQALCFGSFLMRDGVKS